MDEHFLLLILGPPLENINYGYQGCCLILITFPLHLIKGKGGVSGTAQMLGLR